MSSNKNGKSKIKPIKLKGFQDYDPEIMAKRYEIMDAVRNTAKSSGFSMIGTPALEYAETLLGEGGETDKQVYKFEDNGGREVALRFDLTVPFARYASENYGSYPIPFKRAQIGDVWRAEKNQKGRYREFAQCDFDIIGVDTVHADLEVVYALSKTLSDLNIGSFTISFGHRYILSGLLSKFLPNLMATENGETEALIAIDKLDKIGAEKVVELLEKIEGATKEGAELLMNVIASSSSKSENENTEVLEKIEKIFEGSSDLETSFEALKRVKFITNKLNELLKGTGSKALVDLKIARGLAYYTGVVFETTLDEIPGFGSICSGGRYNNLCDRFSNRELPGVGGSIGLDRLVAGLVELGKVSSNERQGVFVAVADDSSRSYALDTTFELRENGISCDIDLKGQKIGKQFQAADKLNKKYVIAIGSNELERMDEKILILKDLSTGSQEEMPLSEIINRLKK